MRSRTALKILLALVLGLPLLQVVLGWVGKLFQALGDAATATVLGYVGTGVGVTWLVSVVGLVVVLAVQTLDGTEEPGE